MTRSHTHTTRWDPSGSACLRRASSCGADAWGLAVVTLGVIHPVSGLLTHLCSALHILNNSPQKSEINLSHKINL